MKKLLKEPFFHFILIGAAMFVLYGLVNDKSYAKNTILINDFDVSALISKWKMQWKRPPTEKELQNLINLNIKQEIFYQEALAMNLDHNDEIIKRRLAQKMQFLSNDIAAIFEPTDEDLKAHYNKHADKYMTPTSYSLYQITFSPDKRKDNYKDAEETLKQFPDATFEEMKQWGDQLPFNYYFEDINANELGLQLGSKFSTDLENQELNKWVGPVSSGFGYHLVYITNKVESEISDFESAKKTVLRDFEYDNQKEINELIYKELKKKYDIEIDIKSEDFDPKFVEYLQTELNN
ncbi:MAG: peptidyl-prolyl cis-trans isomerase [Flavobacteriaceae bacterium]|nr:peptidyl-prolyl cis-trans isomerase [Flavobacteriaceae bacterium]